MELLQLKQALIVHLLSYLAAKKNVAKEAVQAAQDSANTEDKSSAGDKYETGRAMAQNNRDMYAKQLQLIINDEAQLYKLTNVPNTGTIKNGSVIKTNQKIYYIGLGVGVQVVNNEDIVCLSASSPLASAFLGKQVGEWVVWGKDKFLVEEIQ